jgi:hypothetical protein
MRNKLFSVTLVGIVSLLIGFWLGRQRIPEKTTNESVSPVKPKGEMFYGFNTSKEIRHWAVREFGDPDTYEFQGRGRKFFVVFGSHSSGYSLKEIYVYLWSDGSWKLLMLEYTNTSKVVLKKDEKNGKLVFLSKKGSKLLDLNMSGVNLDYDPNEQ